MSKSSSPGDFNTQIYEEASAWFVEMRAGDVDARGRRKFDAWLRKSPEHLRAYLEVSEIWDDATHVDTARTGDSETLLADAKAAAEVVSLRKPSARVPVPDFKASWRAHLAAPRLATAAAIGVVACGLAAYLEYQHSRTPTYSTAIGEQRFVTLMDGSRVELNSLTRLAVRFSDQQRDVELLEGQALFKVAKDPHRPFIVHSRNLVARAVGTEFDVDLKRDTTTVTVLEGRVAVHAVSESSLRMFGSPEIPAIAPTMVIAGEQVTGTAHGKVPLQTAHANIAAATAWVRGSLVFQGTRLADVIEEFNRHNERQILLEDHALEDLQISGVYATTDPQLLLRFLREQPHVRVVETTSRVVITSM